MHRLCDRSCTSVEYRWAYARSPEHRRRQPPDNVRAAQELLRRGHGIWRDLRGPDAHSDSVKMLAAAVDSPIVDLEIGALAESAKRTTSQQGANLACMGTQLPKQSEGHSVFAEASVEPQRFPRRN